MPHGAPDWAEMAPRTTIYGGIDLAELAVRLGSIVSFDRRGDVVYLDDFQSGIEGYTYDLYGTDAAKEWSTETKKTGGLCLKLTGGKDAECRVDFMRGLHPSALKKIGFEFSWTFFINIDRMSIILKRRTGTESIEYSVRYDQVNEKLEYRGSDDEWHDIATGRLCTVRLDAFNTWKLVADFEEEEFVRFILNETEYDLSGIAPFREPDASVPHTLIQGILKSRETFNDVAYIHDVILTQNEP